MKKKITITYYSTFDTTIVKVHFDIWHPNQDKFKHIFDTHNGKCEITGIKYLSFVFEGEVKREDLIDEAETEKWLKVAAGTKPPESGESEM